MRLYSFAWSGKYGPGAKTAARESRSTPLCSDAWSQGVNDA